MKMMMKYTHRKYVDLGRSIGQRHLYGKCKKSHRLFDTSEGGWGCLRPTEFPMETYSVKNEIDQDHR
jgi:hypothetical protein